MTIGYGNRINMKFNKQTAFCDTRCKTCLSGKGSLHLVAYGQICRLIFYIDMFIHREAESMRQKSGDVGELCASEGFLQPW